MINFTIWKTVWNFFHWLFELEHANLFDCVSKVWSIGLRRFGLLDGAEQKVFVIFPQESFFHLVGLSVPSYICLAYFNCPLHIIEELFTLDQNFANECIVDF